jgi:hypothetical protein
MTTSLFWIKTPSGSYRPVSSPCVEDAVGKPVVHLGHLSIPVSADVLAQYPGATDILPGYGCFCLR